MNGTTAPYCTYKHPTRFGTVLYPQVACKACKPTVRCLGHEVSLRKEAETVVPSIGRHAPGRKEPIHKMFSITTTPNIISTNLSRSIEREFHSLKSDVLKRSISGDVPTD
jgi:hypothetical protein